jgi:ABC-type sugar transport system permease subunit
MNNQFESTYALLVRSQEKGRGILEAVLYVAFILSAVLLIWIFAQSPINIRAAGVEPWAVEAAANSKASPQS